MERLKLIGRHLISGPQRERSVGLLIGCLITAVSTGLQVVMRIGEFSSLTNWILFVPASLAMPGLAVGTLVTFPISGNVHDDSMVSLPMLISIPVNCLLYGSLFSGILRGRRGKDKASRRRD